MEKKNRKKTHYTFFHRESFLLTWNKYHMLMQNFIFKGNNKASSLHVALLLSSLTLNTGPHLWGMGVLLHPFLKIEISSLIYKKSALILEKSALFVCIYGLDSYLKCSFNSIFEKYTNIFLCGVRMSYMKRLWTCP